MTDAYDRIRAGLEANGFTIRLPFRTDRYNTAIANVEQGHVTSLPPGRDALLLGNSREAWPHFLRSWRQDDALRTSEHPFDRWVERTLTGTVSVLPGGARWYWGHAPGGQRPSLLHAAQAAGLPPGPAWLVAHPVYGPWFALRAVLLPADPHVVTALAAPLADTGPCGRCETTPCLRELQQVRSRSAPDLAQTGILGPEWRSWVRVREACPIGQAWRYGAQQLTYHYTKRTDVLTSHSGCEGASSSTSSV